MTATFQRWQQPLQHLHLELLTFKKSTPVALKDFASQQKKISKKKCLKIKWGTQKHSLIVWLNAPDEMKNMFICHYYFILFCYICCSFALSAI